MDTLNSRQSLQMRWVRQFSYTAWPDHGVPADVSELLMLRSAVRTYHDPNHPILVHCRSVTANLRSHHLPSTLPKMWRKFNLSSRIEKRPQIISKLTEASRLIAPARPCRPGTGVLPCLLTKIVSANRVASQGPCNGNWLLRKPCMLMATVHRTSAAALPSEAACGTKGRRTKSRAIGI